MWSSEEDNVSSKVRLPKGVDELERESDEGPKAVVGALVALGGTILGAYTG